MKTMFRLGLLISVAVLFFTNGRSAEAQTVYDPSANDPRIRAVLDARRRAEEAASKQDWKTVESLFAPEVVVNSPTNRVVRLNDIMARFRNGQIAAEPGTNTSQIEFVGVIGDSVVVMGEESFIPGPNAPNAGTRIRRRATDVWRQYNGVWKLAIRQGTITSVE
jgi:ketosteroid isomerase-like protein